MGLRITLLLMLAICGAALAQTVTGPASSTTNGVATWRDATGKRVKNNPGFRSDGTNVVSDGYLSLSGATNRVTVSGGSLLLDGAAVGGGDAVWTDNDGILQPSDPDAFSEVKIMREGNKTLSYSGSSFLSKSGDDLGNSEFPWGTVYTSTIRYDGNISLVASPDFGVQVNSGGYFVPVPDLSVDLGTADNRWKNLYASNATFSGTTAATGGFASTDATAAVTIAASGWTNTFGKNAVVYYDGTAVTAVVKNGAGTAVYTNTAALTGMSSILLQPSGAVVLSGTGVVGRATPF